MNAGAIEPKLQAYLTAHYPCSYLPEQLARSQVILPASAIDAQAYGLLAQEGFRRSGELVYRPACEHCQACLPLRVDVSAFRPNRSQSRAWRRWQTLEPKVRPLVFEPEHFALFQRYQARRHPEGSMARDSEDDYRLSMLHSQVGSFLLEYREAGTLRMVSLVDPLPDGWSAVYTFFDPDLPGASLGVYGVLRQIACCREMGLPHLYLGYWIAACRKMNYKAQYQPCQIFSHGRWQPWDASAAASGVRAP